jgi:hypothetical protein
MALLVMPFTTQVMISFSQADTEERYQQIFQ